jgi:hypothetical protein
MGLVMRHSFSIGLYTMVIQAEIYAIDTCVMYNAVKGYTGRNNYRVFHDFRA